MTQYFDEYMGEVRTDWAGSSGNADFKLKILLHSRQGGPIAPATKAHGAFCIWCGQDQTDGQAEAHRADCEWQRVLNMARGKR